MAGRGAVTVGVDVGGTKCLAVALAGNRVVAEGRVATPDGGAAVLDAVAALALQVAGDRPLAAMGAGMPGLVDRDGVLRFAPNLPGVTGLPVRDELERRLGVPVSVDNDATCAAWAERAMGAATGLDDVVLVTLGTGIGGGIITGGRLTRGANGFAGEIGHMVVDRDGPACPCGQRGCWERYASGSGLAWHARRAVGDGRAAAVLALAGGDPAAILGEHVAVAASTGDADAVALVAELGWWVTGVPPSFLPLLNQTLWALLPLLCQVTVFPTKTETDFGVKKSSSALTDLFAARAEALGQVRSRTAKRNGKATLRITSLYTRGRPKGSVNRA